MTSPEQGTGSAQAGYEDFMKARIEALNSSETQPLYKWLRERIDSLPEMKVGKASLTDGQNWKHTMTPEGQVNSVNGSFFDIEGRAVKTPTQSWEQPATIASETKIDLPTPDGVKKLDVSGFVGIIRDKDGRVLLSVGQEPLAKTLKKALVRTPFQTSAAKLEGLMNGKSDLDPGLADLLAKIGQGKSISELFATGVVKTFPLAPADANRIEATNIGFSITVTDNALRDSLVEGNKNRWCSAAEVKALSNTGIVNGHTSSALQAVS